jgi:hypothetical protein
MAALAVAPDQSIMAVADLVWDATASQRRGLEGVRHDRYQRGLPESGQA